MSLLSEAYTRRLVAYEDFYNKNHSKTDGQFISGPGGSSGGKIWSGVSAHPDHRKAPKPKVTIPVKGDEFQTAEQAALGLGQRVYAGNLGGGFKSHVTSTETVANTLTVHIKITDKDGKQVGLADRMISTENGKLVVDHSNLFIDAEYHGQGIADRFNAHAVAQYQQLGVDHITLHAADAVGGFAWARQGFRINEEGSSSGDQYRRDFLLKQLDRTKTTFNIPALRGHTRQLNRDVAAIRRAINAGEDVQPIHIASIGEKYARFQTIDPTNSGGRKYKTWPGKQLLLRTTWHGVYYFDANNAVTAAASSIEHARLRPAFTNDIGIVPDLEQLACHDASCAPPPVGVGGSSPSGKSTGFGGPSAHPDHRTLPSKVTDIRKMGDERRLRFAQSLFETNLPGDHHTVVDVDESYSVANDNYYVRGHILTKYGREVGFFERTIAMDGNKLVIGHDKLAIDDHSLHQLGLGTEFIGHSIAQYKRNGVDHVEVYAGDEVGGYMWAREGFRLKSGSRVELIASFAVNAQAKVGRALKRGLVTQEQHNAIVAESNALIRASDHGEDAQPIHAASLGRYARWKATDQWGNSYETWAGKEAMLGQGYPADYFFDYANARTASAALIEALACHDAACAPPPAGVGGSSPGALQARRGVVPGYGPASLRDVHLGGVKVTYKPDWPDDHPDPGEVVWARVPFEDDPSQSKDRPVLIIGRVNGSTKLAGIQLTTQVRGRKFELPIGTGSWDRLGRQTAVRLDRIVQIDPSNYRREGSVFERAKFDSVIGHLAAYHRTPVQIAASARLEEFYNQNHSKADGKFTSGAGGEGGTFKVITKAEARGDSRPVSHAEFQRLANIGKTQLEGFARNAKRIDLSEEQWSKIKHDAYAEVVKSWGGATIDMHTGKQLPQGVDAYAVTVKSLKGKTIQNSVSVHENATEAEFHAAMEVARKRFGYTLARENHYLGVFHDDENHRIDIDPVLVVTKREDVDTIGAATHAIGGAYHFASGNGFWPPFVEET